MPDSTENGEIVTTLQALIPAYREYLEHERKSAKTTIYAYASDAGKLAAYLGDKPVGNIRRDDLRGYMRHLSKQGYKANTVRRVFHGFGTLFKWLYLEGLIEKVLTEYLDLPRKNDTSPTWMTETELKAFLNEAKHAPALEGIAWATLALTGMRPDELRHLTVGSVKLSPGDSFLIVRNTKSRRDRVLPLHDGLIEGFTMLIEGKADTAYVFSNAYGRIWKRGKMIEAFNRQLDGAGLSGRGYTLYTLRHSFATHLANSGVNLHEVKEALGHKSLETTGRYVHTSHASIKRAMSKVTGE